MPPVIIECPSCNWEGKLDDSLLGRKIKCPKCQASFQAEVGGTYDLAGPARPPRPERQKGDADADRPEAPAIDPDQKARLDAWADDEEE